MSKLHPSDREALRRAGFTEREINTQQQKFYNLTQINPCYTNELRQFQQLMEDRRALLDELKYIADANPKDWYEEMRDQFQQWAQSRARAAIAKATGGEV